MKSKSMGLTDLALCTFEVFLENCLHLPLLLLLLLLLLVNNQKRWFRLVAATSHTNMQKTKHINCCLQMKTSSREKRSGDLSVLLLD